MPVYTIELKVAATAYVRAETKEQAIAALKDEISERYGTDLSDFQIGGLAADISISPAMTVWGPWGSWSEMERADE
jgi:hypothetical protein